VLHGGIAAVLQQVICRSIFTDTPRCTRRKANSRWKDVPILQAAQVRRDDRTDRAAVDRAVSVATDVFENRADVQARAAADTMEHVALLDVGESSVR